VDHWPVPATLADVPTGHGTIHMLICGEPSSPTAVWHARSPATTPERKQPPSS